MAKYSKILLALDFAGDNQPIIDKALQIVADDGAELHLIHVHEPVVTAYQAGGMAAYSTQIAALDVELRKQGEANMADMAGKLGVPQERCHRRFGKASAEIRDTAKEADIDLIVMGTHGQSGLKLMLGSTANAVLHGVTCDVLAVRT